MKPLSQLFSKSTTSCSRMVRANIYPTRALSSSVTPIKISVFSRPFSSNVIRNGATIRPVTVRPRSISTQISFTEAAPFLCQRRCISYPSLRRSEVLSVLGSASSHLSNNVPASIIDKIERREAALHVTPNHPLSIIRTSIENYWKTKHPSIKFDSFNDLSPIVSVKQNFDDLLIPQDHVSRSQSDTYYVDDTRVLRTHTSAHQSDILKLSKAFLVSGDVYRRDEIDSSHYPIFHQMEGVRIFDGEVSEQDIVSDLKVGLEGLALTLFGDVEMRWVDAYFPFTNPSFELEIYYGGEWLEVLGCGVVQRKILNDAGLVKEKGWAFGLGLERLAMVLFSIPDIRLFWSEDSRFTSQFVDEKVTKFIPYSKYPPCLKDISFWIDSGEAATSLQGRRPYHANDFNEAVRTVAGDLVERVELVDSFTNPKTGRKSHCYRITYRSMDRNLTNVEIDDLQTKVREFVADNLEVELR